MYVHEQFIWFPTDESNMTLTAGGITKILSSTKSKDQEPSHTLKLSPHPHVPLMLGLLKMNSLPSL